MGRQINYYIDKKTEYEFAKFLFTKDFNIIFEDVKNKEIYFCKNIQDYDKLKDLKCELFIYKDSYEIEKYINKSNYRRIDSTISPVIEFTRTFIIEEEKKIVRGRLWYETKYFNENGELVAKDERILKEFNSLVKWIKKNVLYTTIMECGYPVKEYITEEIKKLVDEDGFALI